MKNKFLYLNLYSPIILGKFLPGITTTLFKIITGDFKQGHGVFVGALSLLSQVIVSNMSDEINPVIQQEKMAAQ